MTADELGTARAYVVVRPPRELDMSTASNLRADIDRALGVTSWVIIDMTDVDFVDSTGISEVIRAHNLASRNGGDAVVVGASERTMRLLHITQVDRVVRAYERIEDVPPP